MNAVSVCSGIGGLDEGLRRAGWDHVLFCEKDGWRRDVLAEHWPGVPIADDIETLECEPGAADLVCGGTPCQDLSVGGRRAGLAGERSGLFREFVRVADRVAPDWLLWENVDGALSSHEGEDFAVVLEGITGYRPGVPEGGWRSAGVCAGPKRAASWRVLDSQYFGVPQRRRRVFVVGHPRAASAAAVLLEPDCCEGHPAPRHTPREDDARTFGVGVAGTLSELTGGCRTTDLDGHGAYVTDTPHVFVKRMNAHTPDDFERWEEGDVASTLHDHRATQPRELIVTPIDLRNATRSDCATGVGTPSSGIGEPGAPSYPVTGADSLAIEVAGSVRRLTVLERLRLQGFPDDWLGEPNEPPDAPKMSAIGAAVTVPVAEWIGRRMIPSGIERSAP